MVIAIDGPAGAGKSTVARRLAQALGFTYLDSGAMYRCLALASQREGVDPDDAERVAEIASRLRICFTDGRVTLDGEEVTEEVRSPAVTEHASRVSVHPGVREAMVDRQRELIERGRYVAEGRDIGTVVSPDSPLKVFLTAAPDERARRRAAQTGEPLGAVIAAQAERDARDAGRFHAPLAPAADAVELDTTDLSVAEAVEAIAGMARERGLS